MDMIGFLASTLVLTALTAVIAVHRVTISKTSSFSSLFVECGRGILAIAAGSLASLILVALWDVPAWRYFIADVPLVAIFGMAAGMRAMRIIRHVAGAGESGPR